MKTRNHIVKPDDNCFMNIEFDLSVKNREKLANAVIQAKKKNIVLPTYSQMIDPALIPDNVKQQLLSVGLWDLDPINLFRINWHNESKEAGGGFTGVNFLQIPQEISGVDAKIICITGKWFPTGAHKVGAAYGCLVPELITGGFDPVTEKAVWPSTGNYCRGGAYDSNLLACESIAILPEGMSKERFEWLNQVAGEVIKTFGSESNVKEIFDKCAELRQSGESLKIFNQFDQFGNYVWHYEVTGRAIHEVLNSVMQNSDRFTGLAISTGSAGTIASGDYLKQQFPHSKIIACEALQCPTMSNNGFGSHHIEGIGDKHIPWIHNVKNTDFISAVDDNACLNVMRLFNSDVGREYLLAHNVSSAVIEKLELIAISGIGNLLSAIKFAKYHELTADDIIVIVATDSMAMYQSRLQELQQQNGELDISEAAAIYHQYLLGQQIDHFQELSYQDRKRIHNLKYYTWVEQQGKTAEQLNAQWYEDDYWWQFQGRIEELDNLINDFNLRVASS